MSGSMDRSNTFSCCVRIRQAWDWDAEPPGLVYVGQDRADTLAHEANPGGKFKSANSAVLRYRSPVLGNTVTMSLPLFSGRLAT